MTIFKKELISIGNNFYNLYSNEKDYPALINGFYALKFYLKALGKPLEVDNTVKDLFLNLEDDTKKRIVEGVTKIIGIDLVFPEILIGIENIPKLPLSLDDELKYSFNDMMKVLSALLEVANKEIKNIEE